MSDTWVEKSIVLAIKIITDKKISQASYDKTVRAIVKKVVDKATGEYLLRFQDSDFTAYTTTSEIVYRRGDEVYVLVPGNDWTRIKTIIGSTRAKSTNYVLPLIPSEAYNISGMNGIVGVLSSADPILLGSYNNSTFRTIYSADEEEGIRQVIVDQDNVKKGIRNGGGLVLAMAAKTVLDDSQVGGLYGLIFNLKFHDATTTDEEVMVVRPYTISSRNVIGNPYALLDYTTVSTFIEDIDIDNFDSVESIQVYCQGFPHQGLDQLKNKDIFIKDIQIIGAESLTDLELQGYCLNINISKNGDTLNKVIKELNLVAELKVKGRKITKDVEYYWFVLNGSVYRGDLAGRYSSYGGDGWLCVNWKNNNTPESYKTNNITFIQETLTRKLNQKIKLIALKQRTTRIKCVALYMGLHPVEKLIDLYNTNLGDIRIKSSDLLLDGLNRTVYYLDSGNPNLRCLVYNNEGRKLSNLLLKDYKFLWYVVRSNGRSELVPEVVGTYNEYIKYYGLTYVAKNKSEKTPAWMDGDGDIYQEGIFWSEINPMYDGYYVGLEKVPQSDKQSYINRNNKNTIVGGAKENWLTSFKNKSFAYKNKYVNFPIKSISGSRKVYCVVYDNEKVYKGTGTIILENRRLLSGMYSLTLNNASQVFQYDGKGNSPTSPQLLRPLTLDPLTFALIDNKGRLITFDQIKQNGLIKWIIPNTQTLLGTTLEDPGELGNGRFDMTVLRATLPLAPKDYTVYKNLQSFHFTIKDRYDLKLSYNDIWLHVRFKDMLFDAYTNFTFPKQGDPGTNGTDYVAKIVPNTGSVDRIYLSNSNGKMYDDNGTKVENLKFLLYNNSVKIDSINTSNNTWTILNKNSGSNTTIKATGNLGGNSCTVGFLNSPPSNFNNNTVNIVRCTYLGSNNLTYYAEYPINTVYLDNVNDITRLKIRPKTGFKYVMYSLDGTSPSYDNSLPFEIIVLKNTSSLGYFIESDLSFEYTWSVSDPNLLSIDGTNKSKFFKVIPADKFNGYDLNAAVICKVTGVGSIHIPIYMYLNRYNNSALNAWDGNSILLGDNNGTILAPQIGAGKKDDKTNTFTGVLLGTQKVGAKEETGFFGYNQGQRSITLDSETGSAIFGKDKKGQIKIDALSDLGIIQSGDYKDGSGEGMKIKFSSTGYGLDEGPYIKYGSGNFSVNKDGELIAKGGGSIAGWEITDDKLISIGNNGKDIMYLKSKDYSQSEPYSIYTANGNFTVKLDGYLFSKSGNIAGWLIVSGKLYNGLTGMASPGGVSVSLIDASLPLDLQDPFIAFFAGKNNFYVTHKGFLFSKSGNIAGWNIKLKMLGKTLNNSQIGLGENTFKISKNSKKKYGISEADNYYDNKNIQARFWSINTNDNADVGNFIVDNEGRLFASSGYIGGWKITQGGLKSSKLSSDEKKKYLVTIKNDGSIVQETTEKGKDSVTNWTINALGSAIFENIMANKGWIGGSDSGWKIDEGKIQDKNGKVVLSINEGIGSIKAKNGVIGGWTIGENSLKAGQMTIDGSNGSMSGSNWAINNNGDAYFNTIYGTVPKDKTITGSGMSIGGGGTGGSYIAPTVGVGSDSNTTTTLENWVKKIVTDTLVADNLVVKGKQIDWKGLRYISMVELKEVTINPQTITFTIDGKTYSVLGSETTLNYPSTSASQDILAPIENKSEN